MNAPIVPVSNASTVSASVTTPTAPDSNTSTPSGVSAPITSPDVSTTTSQSGDEFINRLSNLDGSIPADHELRNRFDGVVNGYMEKTRYLAEQRRDLAAQQAKMEQRGQELSAALSELQQIKAQLAQSPRTPEHPATNTELSDPFDKSVTLLGHTVADRVSEAVGQKLEDLRKDLDTIKSDYEARRLHGQQRVQRDAAKLVNSEIVAGLELSNRELANQYRSDSNLAAHLQAAIIRDVQVHVGNGQLRPGDIRDATLRAVTSLRKLGTFQPAVSAPTTPLAGASSTGKPASDPRPALRSDEAFHQAFERIQAMRK